MLLLDGLVGNDKAGLLAVASTADDLLALLLLSWVVELFWRALADFFASTALAELSESNVGIFEMVAHTRVSDESYVYQL